MKIIARIESDFKEKFGIPRQSGIADELVARIIFEPEYRVSEALRGIDGYSHLWLIWQFSEAVREDWSPTVRPPRLGGNRRVGVFASRSPFRPNPIGLSCVKLVKIENAGGTVELTVEGADLLDGTPILDIKPYLPFADCVPNATAGYASSGENHRLQVHFPEPLLQILPQEKQAGAIECLADDPRPSYQEDPSRVYGMRFGAYEIKFQVEDDLLTVVQVEKVNIKD